MSQETISPISTVTAVAMRDFNGNALDLGLPVLSDGDFETGIRSFGQPSEITFRFPDPGFVTFSNATLQYRIEELGGGTKGAIFVSLDGDQIDVFEGTASQGDIKKIDLGEEFDPASMTNENGNTFSQATFGITMDSLNTKISEVEIILTILGGQVKITQGKVTILKGKITI